MPRGLEQVGEGTDFPEELPRVPACLRSLGWPASWRPPPDLGGYPRPRLPTETRPLPGALTLQLLALILLGLVFFEQAGQHGWACLGVGTTGPSLRLRELDCTLARSGRSHVIAASRDAGASRPPF